MQYLTDEGGYLHKLIYEHGDETLTPICLDKGVCCFDFHVLPYKAPGSVGEEDAKKIKKEENQGEKQRGAEAETETKKAC